MVELLGEARQLTRENVERKQARNIDEMQDEENDANNGREQSGRCASASLPLVPG